MAANHSQLVDVYSVYVSSLFMIFITPNSLSLELGTPTSAQKSEISLRKVIIGSKEEMRSQFHFDRANQLY